MPRSQKRYHYIYKTTCLVTGKFYVGMHSTDDLDDGYLGSGKILGYSRAKHGDQNHKKEIIEMCPNREALKLREREIVNEELLADPLNMNLKYGGDGGSHGRESEAWSRPGFKERVALLQSNGTKLRWKDPEYASKQSLLKRKLWQDEEYRKKMSARTPPFLHKQHSQQSCEKISASMIGKQDAEKNSQYGTCWVTNGLRPIKIKKELLDQYLKKGYWQGRK